MLFALHLNAATVRDDDASSSEMKYGIGDAMLCFRSSTCRGLLLVASVHTELSSEGADHLTSELLARLQKRFAAQLDARATQGAWCSLKRRAFQGDLTQIVFSLASWMVAKAEVELRATWRDSSVDGDPGKKRHGSLAGMDPSSVSPIRVAPTLSALLDRSMCDALHPSRTSVKVVEQEDVWGSCGCFPRIGRPPPSKGTPIRARSRGNSARRPAPHGYQVAIDNEEPPILWVHSANSATEDAVCALNVHPQRDTHRDMGEKSPLFSRLRPLDCHHTRSVVACNALLLASQQLPAPHEGRTQVAQDAADATIDAIVLVRPPLLFYVRAGDGSFEVQESREAATQAASAISGWIRPLQLTMVLLESLLVKQASRSIESIQTA